MYKYLLAMGHEWTLGLNVLFVSSYLTYLLAYLLAVQKFRENFRGKGEHNQVRLTKWIAKKKILYILF